jgi:hypothetical protein
MLIPGLLALMGLAMVQQNDPFQDLDQRKEVAKPAARSPTGLESFFDENFTFKKEIYSQFSYSSVEPNPGQTLVENTYSRQSLGLEILKKFSTSTSTVASVDVQARVVRRDTFVMTLNDMEGMNRQGWAFEYHNLYVDLYNVLNPFLSEEAQNATLGRFNLRAGHFYVPFGLNLQTDTHGTLIQLSNDRNFGFERDWYAGFWGSITSDLNYDLYYLAGSGYPLAFRGQGGMVGARISLSSQVRNEGGLEGGLSFIRGGRISMDAVARSPSVADLAGPGDIVDTLRGGLDARYTIQALSGSLSFTLELSGGRDESDAVLAQLYEVDYLAERRDWGLSVQYRRFWQDIRPGLNPPPGFVVRKTEASAVVEFTWYFRNDITNAFVHCVRLNVERQSGPAAIVVTIQYYFYW